MATRWQRLVAAEISKKLNFKILKYDINSQKKLSKALKLERGAQLLRSEMVYLIHTGEEKMELTFRITFGTLGTVNPPEIRTREGERPEGSVLSGQRIQF